MHIKYRPTKWEDVIGNNHIKSFIEHSKGIEYNHTLFEGPTGCGKTTFAYIMAREHGAAEENIIDLNCVHTAKVEEIREIMEQLEKSSIFGLKKVLILDEIHELSPKAQQVLLKPLEKVAMDTLIIACTTTTANVKDTLLDRFVRFKVSKLSKTQSKQLIDYVSEKEGIKLKRVILSMLIEKADGIPRRLLTGLAKVKNITEESEAEYLLELETIEESEDLFDLFKLMLYGKNMATWSEVAKKLKSVLSNEKPEAIRIGLLNIASARLLSNSFNNSQLERGKLDRLHTLLTDWKGYPEKANLLFALHKFITGV